MPDGGGQNANPASRDNALLPSSLGGDIERDEIDLRDRTYEPTLAQLRSVLLPDPRLVARMLEASETVLLPRNQGDEGTCGGHALAALIDIQRFLTDIDPHNGTNAPAPVSARMLYQMAVNRKEHHGRNAGVTLREVIKGFYNYGVCSEAVWPYVARSRDRQLNFKRARNAKNISLGAYYRLRPNLNSYHAALNETGAILVSAELHKGWKAENVADANGEIRASREYDSTDDLALEKHAFTIVGYTPIGFLVLNSWGPAWGGYPDPETGAPIPGLALWRYEDWADRILDGWVLRLGVGAAEAFDYSIGDQGLGFGHDAAVRSTPVHAVLGHYLHCDDGQYVPYGRYPSDEHSLEETFRLLETDAAKPQDYGGTGSIRKYEGVLLTFAGGLLGLRDAADQIARWKHVAKSAGWFPMTALWCVDYVEQTRSVLQGIFEEGLQRFGKQGDALDSFIETRSHGIGRALWRDLEDSAEIGVQRRMGRKKTSTDEIARAPFASLISRLTALSRNSGGYRLRIIAESEGAIALSCILNAFAREVLRDPERSTTRARFFAMLESVDIIAPPMSVAEYDRLENLMLEGWSSTRQQPGPLRLHLASKSHERRLEVPPYSKSYTDLVVNAFHPRGSGNAPENRALTYERAERRDGARSELLPIAWPAGKIPAAKSPIRQTELIYASDVGARIRAALA